MKMVNSKILLKEIEKPDEVNGLYVAKDEEQSLDCTVVKTEEGSKFKEGDVIFLSRYNVLKAYIDGEHYLITDEQQIWGVREKN